MSTLFSKFISYLFHIFFPSNSLSAPLYIKEGTGRFPRPFFFTSAPAGRILLFCTNLLFCKWGLSPSFSQTKADTPPPAPSSPVRTSGRRSGHMANRIFHSQNPLIGSREITFRHNTLADDTELESAHITRFFHRVTLFLQGKFSILHQLLHNLAQIHIDPLDFP